MVTEILENEFNNLIYILIKFHYKLLKLCGITKLGNQLLYSKVYRLSLMRVQYLLIRYWKWCLPLQVN